MIHILGNSVSSIVLKSLYGFLLYLAFEVSNKWLQANLICP
jgi:hypothetical protein